MLEEYITAGIVGGKVGAYVGSIISSDIDLWPSLAWAT